MVFITIIQHYLLWHYTHAYAELFHVYKNFMWFMIHFFSLPSLARTLFSPFKRITEERHKAWDLEDFAGSIIINIISRIIGAIVRGTILLFGLISLLVTTLLGATIYALWFVAPVIIVATLVLGVVYLFI